MRASRAIVLAYLTVLLMVPVGLVFYRTFEGGIGPVWDSVTTPAAVSAFWLTITIAIVFELFTAILIRDNLALNVLMLVWPIDAVKAWQSGA